MDQIIKHILPQDFVKYIDSSNEEAVEETVEEAAEAVAEETATEE